MKRLIDDRPMRCAHCGKGRLIPLTVTTPRAEHRLARRIPEPVRAELKCVACGRRHVARPGVLLAG